MVNASYAPNEFYKQRVTGMAPGANYNLTFWAANLSPASPLQPNILAGVTDTSSGATLGSVSTGALAKNNAWHQYTFAFTATLTTVDVFLQNNAPGGFGNDLAIDDISLTQDCGTVLAVNLTSFNALKQGCNVLLRWTAACDPALNYFSVERSTDKGNTWKTIERVMASRSSGPEQDYSFEDSQPASGTNFYRLQTQYKTGNVSFSTTRRIEMQNIGAPAVTVYPNPVAPGKKLHIQMAGLDAGTYKIRLVSSSGQVVRQVNYHINYAGNGVVMLPTAGTSTGTYVVMVKGNNQQFTRQVVIENQ